MQSQKYMDMKYLSQYREYLYKNPKLKYLFFELTDACNLSCLHCGSNACPQNHTYLPVDLIKTVLTQVSEAFSPNDIMICLSGGEPLLHPSLFEIIKYAKKCGFSCGMTTNGTLIDQTNAKRLADSGIDSVTFSVDGLEDTHDWFRNKPGSFCKTIEGIQNLLQYSQGKITTQITTVVHKRNIHQLDEMFQLACVTGVDSWRVVNLEPIGRALDNSELLLDAKQFRQLFSYIQEKRYAMKTPIDVTYGCSHYLSEELERTVRDHYFLCGSGILVASILCNGDIYSCMDIERRPELVQGNIYTDSFVDAWHNRFQIYRKDRSMECSMCCRCDDRAFCCGDAAHTWDYSEKKPLVCIKQILTDKESCDV